MQKVKVSAGYSDKISENYNSKQYSIALEMELQINGNTADVELASSKLFALCRKIVSAQKEVSIDGLLNQTAAAPAFPQSAAAAPTATNGNNPPKLASQKQVKFILELARKSGISHDDIRRLPSEFNKNTLVSLTSQEASALIDRLSQKKAA